MTPPHVAAPVLAVTDLTAALHFYRSVCGMQRVDYFVGNDEYAVVGRGDAHLHLMVAPRSNPNHRNGAHVADAFVWVDDLDPIVAAARDVIDPRRPGRLPAARMWVPART